MKIKLLLLLASFFSLTVANAQLSSFDYNGETKMKISVRYGQIGTSGVDMDSVVNAKGILLRVFEMDKINAEVGGYNASHRWAFIPETFVLAIIDAIDGGDFEWGSRNSTTYIGDFILGWHNHTFNLVYTDKFSVGAGVHWGDYFMGYTPYNSAQNNYSKASEPAGWYGALGPALTLDYNLFDKAVIHVEGAYGLSLKFKDFPEMNHGESYPSPHFINVTAQIRSNSFVYGGMEYIRSINRGSNNFNASRTDFFVGIWF